MAFISKNVAFFYLASIVSITSAAESYLRTRELTVCDTLKACYLVNIQTRKETELQGSSQLGLDPLNTEGYSIRCDAKGDNELDIIKFFYDGIIQDEFGLPRYMSGDADSGAFINKADYISTCGQKTVKIEGHVWDRKCFKDTFVIDISNADGTPCNAKPPTAAPVKSPTAAPKKPPTAAPLKSPTRAPVKAPTRTPVKSDLIPAPVTSTCPSPKVWINGCCKDPAPCSYGYYKSFDGKCIRHSWCFWL